MNSLNLSWLNPFRGSVSSDNTSPPPPRAPHSVPSPTSSAAIQMRQNVDAATSTSSSDSLSRSISTIPPNSTSCIPTPSPSSSSSESKGEDNINSTSSSSSFTSSTTAPESFRLEMRGPWFPKNKVAIVTTVRPDDTMKKVKEKAQEYLRNNFQIEDDIILVQGAIRMIDDWTVARYGLDERSKVIVIFEKKSSMCNSNSLSRSISTIPPNSTSCIPTPSPSSSSSESKGEDNINSTSSSSSFTSSTTAPEPFELEMPGLWFPKNKVRIVTTVRPDDTMKKVKEKAQEYLRNIFQIEDDIILVLGGKRMIDDWTAARYGLDKWSKVIVICEKKSSMCNRC